MFIQPHQKFMIMSPKKGCQRGLEEYIVAQHWGDKKIYHEGGAGGNVIDTNDPSYMYLNNPIYRVGKEGDPAPGSLSSRSIYQLGDYIPGFTETESALHLLYPTIDSGSQFNYEKPWDMHWYYSRSNIPNMLGTSEIVATDKAETNKYDDSVERRRVSHQISDWMTRPLPIYDQQRVSDELLPDGVRQVELGTILNRKGVDIIGDTPGKHAVLQDAQGNKMGYAGGIENYTGPIGNKSRFSGFSPSAGLGGYGYPQPHGYAEVGANKHRYDVFPGYIPGVNVEYYGINGGVANNTVSGSSNILWIVAIAFMIGLFLIVRKK